MKRAYQKDGAFPADPPSRLGWRSPDPHRVTRELNGRFWSM
jgi:hypothetical protein